MEREMMFFVDRKNSFTESSTDRQQQLCFLLQRWKVALENSNCDDWRLAINFYDVLKSNETPMPGFVEFFFYGSKKIDVKVFAQEQEEIAATILNIIHKSLYRMKENH